jgi:hypothetical protein
VQLTINGEASNVSTLAEMRSRLRAVHDQQFSEIWLSYGDMRADAALSALINSERVADLFAWRR